MLLTIVVSILICNIQVSKGFSYKNPVEWTVDNPTCDGKSQSPIDIDDSERNERTVKDRSVNWNGYDNIPDIMTGTNNGHTVKVIPEWSDESKRPYLTGGPLNGEYVIQEFHFHWGAQNDAGSEHTINGKSYALELHMVHWKRDYGSFGAAVKPKDGLAVVGSFYDPNNAKEKPSIVMQNLINIVDKLVQNGNQASIQPFPLSNFDVVNTNHTIASYEGSLTTPGCNEAVTWLVAMHGYAISDDQMTAFRSIQLHDDDNHNNRPVQPLNGRQITFYNREII